MHSEIGGGGDNVVVPDEYKEGASGRETGRRAGIFFVHNGGSTQRMPVSVDLEMLMATNDMQHPVLLAGVKEYSTNLLKKKAQCCLTLGLAPVGGSLLEGFLVIDLGVGLLDTGNLCIRKSRASGFYVLQLVRHGHA